MATILNNAPYMGFPLSIKRGNPAPVDTTAVWYDKTELENYAATGATAYVGQILTLYADIPLESGGTKKVCEAYMISNEAGTLVKLAQTTASGDLASDVATLQSQVASLIAAVGKKAAGEEPATGIYKDIEDVIKLANSKVASIKAADKSITVAGTATAPTVKVTLSATEGNALELADDGLKVTIPTVEVPEYIIKQKTLTAEEAKTSPYAAIYQLMKGDTQAGVDINIPKDMVVQSGTVQTFHEGALPEGVDKPGTYIVLILANSGSRPLYIPVSSLVDVYTGTSDEDAKTATVLVNVDPTTHVITASIRTGSIANAMLDSTVQASLKKADTAVQKIISGSETSTNGTITVDGKEVAVKGLANAAYVTVESLNTTAKGYADAAKNAVIGDADTAKAEDKTIEGVKKYAVVQAGAVQTAAEATAKGYVDALSLADKAVDGQVVSAVTQTKGQIAVTRRALVEADIPELAQSKISGLTTALEGKQDTITFDGIYHASTNKAATVSTVNTAADNLRHTLGGEDGHTEIDTKDSETIKGAKLYADSKASAAEAAAKAYADGLVTGDSGITKRVETLEGKVDVDKVSTAIGAAKTAIIGDATNDTADSKTIEGVKKYADNKIKPISDSINDLQAAVSQNGAAITKLNGADTVEGSVDYKIKAAKDALTTEINGKQDRFATVTATENDQTLNFDKGSLSIFTTENQAYDEIRSGKVLQLTATQEIFFNGPVGLAEGKTFKATEGDIQVKTTPTGDTSAVNKSYVDAAITTATAGLTGAMHFKGKLDTLPAAADYDAGDVVIVGQKEYVLLDDKGTKSWSLLGDEGSYAVKGSITDNDIAANAGIKQSKIDGLTDALNAKLNSTTAASTYVAKETGKSLIATDLITKLTNIDTGAQVNKIESIKANGTLLTIDTNKSVNIPAASASAFGVIKVDDVSIKSTDGTIAIKAVSTDLLTQGTQTLILNCGGAAD